MNRLFCDYHAFIASVIGMSVESAQDAPQEGARMCSSAQADQAYEPRKPQQAAQGGGAPELATPKISVVILNYNGQQWLARCFESLERQTFFSQIEVILSDNKSSDGSDQFAAQWLGRTGKGRVVQNGANLYYCAANNNGAAAATGKYLLFLNNDTWLEPDCLEQLYQETEAHQADGAAPLVLNYDDNTFQTMGGDGLDIFGFTTGLGPCTTTTEAFISPGCSLFISAAMFRKTGGFDPKLLIYADETDLSWRVWISGGKLVAVPSARLHHRGAAVVNPAGDTKVVELRTTDTKRFLANRNGLLFLLKDGQHVLLLLAIPHFIWLTAESLVGWAVTRRWSFFRRTYLEAVADCWLLRGHLGQWRARIREFRKRGDFWMLRFLRLRLARWEELRRVCKTGLPKVDKR
jgi:GT2 family glycosyltransferase